MALQVTRARMSRWPTPGQLAVAQGGTVPLHAGEAAAGTLGGHKCSRSGTFARPVGDTGSALSVSANDTRCQAEPAPYLVSPLSLFPTATKRQPSDFAASASQCPSP